MLLSVLLQFVAVIQESYNASGTTIFFVDGVLVNTAVPLNVGTCEQFLKSNNKQDEQYSKAQLFIDFIYS